MSTYLKSFQGALVQSILGRMVKARIDFTGSSTVSTKPFVTNYLSTASTQAFIKQFSLSLPQGMNLKIKNLMYSFRPYYNSNSTPPNPTDDLIGSSNEVELQTNSVFVFNNNTGQYLSIGQSPTSFQNYFAGNIWNGLAPRGLWVQGAAPFSVDGNQDILDITLLSTVQTGTTPASGQWGLVDLLFTEFDVPAWNNTTFNAVVEA